MTSTIDGVEAPPVESSEEAPSNFRRRRQLDLDSPIPLLRAVLREGRRVYERAPGVAATFASRARSVLDLDGPGYDRMMRAFIARVAQRGVGT